MSGWFIATLVLTLVAIIATVSFARRARDCGSGAQPPVIVGK